MDMENLEIRIIKFEGVVDLGKLTNKYGNPTVSEFANIKFYEYEIGRYNFLGMIINTDSYLDSDSSGEEYNILIEARGKSKRKSKNLIKEFEDLTGLNLKIAEGEAKMRGENIIMCKNFLSGCEFLDKLSVGMDLIEYGDIPWYCK